MTPDRKVSLGFADGEFPPGTHICQIFSDDQERNEALLAFVLAGLQAGERTACFSERADAGAVHSFLESHGIGRDPTRQGGELLLTGTDDLYFADERFDLERMLSFLKQFHREAVQSGFVGARVMGEMTPRVQSVPGGTRLLEYESRVSLLLREHPVTTVCQYDAHSFDGATIMDILRVHPMMVVRGAVIHNPFHIPPEEFLTA